MKVLVLIFLLVISNFSVFVLGASVGWLDSLKPIVPRENATHILDAIMSDLLVPVEEKSASHWRKTARSVLKDKLNGKINRNKAKNAILFMGDGMSISTLMATRAYQGQLNNRPGEEEKLSFEDFPVSGLIKTYCIDAQVPDSACTATAYLTGVKTRYGTIGIDGNVARSVCATQLETANHVESIAAWAIAHGLDAGIVTTTRVTHASPAGVYANTAERNWESDADMNPEAIAQGCSDIATQLITTNPGKQLKVIMGGGRSGFYPNLTTLAASEESKTGKRVDGVDLIELWKINKEEKNSSYAYISNRDELRNMVETKAENIPEYVMGLFHDEHMDYHLKASDQQPSLEEMVELAIKVLSRNPKGYFLFVEGGRIDHAHHANLAKIALDETVEFSKAIDRADELTSEDDTLLVVTSDHSHTMTVSGYPSRGNPILGVVDTGTGMDRIPYTTISYANGVGFKESNGSRYDTTYDALFNEGDLDYKYPALVPLDSETHGGEDVAIFARGPWQHLFTSTFEQNAIPHLMAFAMCLEVEKHDACYNQRSPSTYYELNSSSFRLKPSLIFVGFVLFAILFSR